jgi:hypothetical protein
MSSLRWIGWAAALTLAVLTAGGARPQQDPATAASHDVPWLPTDAIRLPDKNAQIEMQEKKAKKQSFDVANEARKKQIEEDAARLVQLATELKAEVDKTDKGTMSLSVMRKADTIEKLAHGVKEKMKLTVY